VLIVTTVAVIGHLGFSIVIERSFRTFSKWPERQKQRHPDCKFSNGRHKTMSFLGNAVSVLIRGQPDPLSMIIVRNMATFQEKCKL